MTVRIISSSAARRAVAGSAPVTVACRAAARQATIITTTTTTCLRHNSTSSTSSTSSSSSSTQTAAAGRDSGVYTVPHNVTDFGAYWRKDTQKAIDPAEAAKSPALVALQARLELRDIVPLETLARTLICQSAQTEYVDNLSMASFGKNLLNYYLYEHFMVTYPRLTPAVLQQTTDLYLSTRVLAEFALSWGVEEDTRSALARYLAEDDANETTRSLFGKLRYNPTVAKKENGVLQLLSGNEISHGRNGALATFVRALVAAVYSHGGLDTAKAFVHSYIIKPKKIDLASMLVFEQPTRELSRLCAREQLEQPVSRLLVETGRFSSHPLFVVGVFSGTSKLGEGQGASLVEAKTRAAVNALKAWYLYTPLNVELPSDIDSAEKAEGYKGAFVDKGSVIV
ncbi:mitochondrial 54S ribosomal protein mL44 [Magnusiomyces paraingens]|uniref:Large ribosomal subunit protein mL44 n=1 Tax=Magnusiomyces paraingens TaxID=2606893 RepID=A0A5E8C0Q0_9ASCO|nr:uncharacterized protein SAPINGB_P004571 [Saprochaete ingens]VVT55387.1 unnamed protein product [Saprochaete ingens]